MYMIIILVGSWGTCG